MGTIFSPLCAFHFLFLFTQKPYLVCTLIVFILLCTLIISFVLLFPLRKRDKGGGKPSSIQFPRGWDHNHFRFLCKWRVSYHIVCSLLCESQSNNGQNEKICSVSFQFFYSHVSHCFHQVYFALYRGDWFFLVGWNKNLFKNLV